MPIAPARVAWYVTGRTRDTTTTTTTNNSSSTNPVTHPGSALPYPFRPRSVLPLNPT